MSRTTGLADFRFDKPGPWLIVARVKSGDLLHPVERAGDRQAIAPFDLECVTFPDARGPATSCAARSVSASPAAG